MKRTFHFLAAAFLFSASVPAQSTTTDPPSAIGLDTYMETGMEVAGVRAPYYDEDGMLRAQLFGGRAKILEAGVAEVTRIRIDVFEDGEQVMTVYAPQCFTRVVDKGSEKVLSVESAGEVLVDLEQMTISGRGFRFMSDSNHFEILSDAKVLVKDSAENIRELEL